MHEEIKKVAKRSLFVGFFLLFLFSLLIVHYYKIQVIEHEKWEKIATSQHYLVIKEPYRRGKIFTKSNEGNHRCVVMDVLTYHLFINPMAIKDIYKEKLIAGLSNLIDGSLKSHFYKKCRWRKISSFLSMTKKEEIETFWKEFAKKNKIAKNALTFVKDYKRSYPQDYFLGQILSTVYKNREEKTGHVLPISGIEKVFDKDLRGDIGKRFLMRSPKYTIDDAKKHISAKNGCDVYLTIHHEIQAICEEELKKGVEKVHAKGGIACMMDPYTGKVLALAQYPFFSPENYAKYYSDSKLQKQTQPKCVTDCFEPGSIIKPITMALGLYANDLLEKNGKEPIFCPYKMIRVDNPNFKGRKKPLRDIGTHKFLNMFLAVQKSSNIYSARIIEKVLERLGPNWYCQSLQGIFGLGCKTNLELPYENRGMIPIYGKKYKNGKSQWSDPTPYSLAIGYNLLVNAMQMARAYSVFANDGYLVEPTIIEKIVTSNGEEKKIPEKEIKRVLPKKIARKIMETLKYTTKKGGSAYLADIPGYTEAGKTSTAEKIVNGVYSKQLHCSSFIGIAPAKNPRFVLILVIDEPQKKFILGFGTTHFGGKCAAPIFREIGKRTLKMLGVRYDDPYGFSKDDPRTDRKQADWNKEAEYINNLYTEWNT